MHVPCTLCTVSHKFWCAEELKQTYIFSDMKRSSQVDTFELRLPFVTRYHQWLLPETCTKLLCVVAKGVKGMNRYRRKVGTNHNATAADILIDMRYRTAFRHCMASTNSS